MAQWLRCCATNRKVAGSIPAGVIGIFHWHKILSIALWSWGRLSLPGLFPGRKGGRCVKLTLPTSCAVVTKSGNLNFLEPSGPLQACNGTALPLVILFSLVYSCTNFLKHLEATSKFWVPERCHETISLLRAPQMWGTAVQNLVPAVTWRPGFVQPWFDH